MAMIGLKDVKAHKKVPDRVMLYGAGGIGKTEFAAQFWSKKGDKKNPPLFLLSEGETGLHKLIESAAIPEIPSLEFRNTRSGDGKESHDGIDNLISVMSELAKGGHDYQTVVFDVFSGFVEMLRRKVIAEDFKGNDSGEKGGYGNYGAGSVKLLTRLNTEIIPAMQELVDSGIRPVLLCHTTVKDMKNPEGPDYQKQISSMPKEIHERVVAWCDMVLYAKSEPILQSQEGFAGKMNYKAVGENRVLRTVDTPASSGKNRHGLPPEIEMGTTGAEAYTNLVNAIRDAQASNRERLKATTV